MPEVLEGLKTKLKAMSEASGGKKVNIISHSMGGVLVKLFMEIHKKVALRSSPSGRSSVITSPVGLMRHPLVTGV